MAVKNNKNVVAASSKAQSLELLKASARKQWRK